MEQTSILDGILTVRVKGLKPMDKAYARCFSCGQSIKITISSLYKNVKNNNGRYRCNACAYEQTKEKRLNNHRVKMADYEVRKKLSAKNKKLWQDPLYRSAVINSNSKSRWSKADLESLFNRSYSKQKVAEELGCSLTHIYRLSNKYGIDFKNSWISKTELDRLYCVQCHSITSIAKMHDKSKQRVKDALKKFDIPIRNQKDACQIRSGQIRKQMKRQWQDSEYIKKMSGDYSTIKEKMQDLSSNQLGKISSIQKILYSILDDLSIHYEPEVKIGFWTYDCLITKYNLIIECQGDYWHSLPKAIRDDKAKATYLQKYFPHCVLKYIWEHEFKCKDRIVNLIKYWAGVEQKLIEFQFDDVEIKHLDKEKAELFLSQYHYAGRLNKGGVRLGGFIRDKLISVCVFNAPLRKQIVIRLGDDTGELSRFAIHPAYQRKNFASWFLSRCIKHVSEKYKRLVTFADTTFNHSGTIYKATNWEFDGEVKPSYWYVDKDGYVMHKKTLWDHAKKMGLSEEAYSEEREYRKVNGKVKYRYVYSY